MNASTLTGEVSLLVAAAEEACVLHELCLLVVRGSLPPAQSQPEKVVRFLSFVQNLAEIHQLTCANPTQPNQTKPNQKKLSGSSPSFRTLQKLIN